MEDIGGIGQSGLIMLRPLVRFQLAPPGTPHPYGGGGGGRFVKQVAVAVQYEGGQGAPSRAVQAVDP